MFFVGLNARWQRYRWLPSDIRVMYSAAGMWDVETHRWGNRRRFPHQAGETFLDWGGYTLLNRLPDYPFTTAAALNLVVWLKPTYYASLDYPCEPDISRSLAGLMTDEERIDRTVENAIRMSEEAVMLGSSCRSLMVPVVQGYELAGYFRCLDLYHEAGIIPAYTYLAVGSFCRRWDDGEISEMIPSIYDHAANLGVRRLHFFGLKLSKELKHLSPFIWSQDSAVALDSYDPGLRAARDGRRFPRGQSEKEAAFYSFLERVDLQVEFPMAAFQLSPPALEMVGGIEGLVDLDSGTLLAMAEELIMSGHISEGNEILSYVGRVGRETPNHPFYDP